MEERAAVGGPRDGGDALGAVAQELARRQVLHVQRVLPESREVHRVGELGRIGAHVHEADGGVLVAPRELVLVEQDLLGRFHRALAAAIDRVLQPLDLAQVVPVSVAQVWHALVGFLDAREDLLVEQLAEALQRLHHRLGVAVLGVEVFDHLGIRFLAQPEVVVHTALAELGEDLGLPARHGRHRRLGDRGLGGKRQGEGEEHWGA